MNSGSFSHVSRTVLKGATFGVLLAPTLAMIARALLLVVVLTTRDGRLDILSIVVGFPAFVLQALLDAGMNGDLGVFALVGLAAGGCVALLVAYAPLRVRMATVVALSAVVGLALYAGIALVNAASAQLLVAPVIGVEGLQWISVLGFAAMTAWIGWRLRLGGVA
jgi:hypothetical protein